jgi:hypothetical protein
MRNKATTGWAVRDGGMNAPQKSDEPPCSWDPWPSRVRWSPSKTQKPTATISSAASERALLPNLFCSHRRRLIENTSGHPAASDLPEAAVSVHLDKSSNSQALSPLGTALIRSAWPLALRRCGFWCGRCAPPGLAWVAGHDPESVPLRLLEFGHSEPSFPCGWSGARPRPGGPSTRSSASTPQGDRLTAVRRFWQARHAPLDTTASTSPLDPGPDSKRCSQAPLIHGDDSSRPPADPTPGGACPVKEAPRRRRSARVDASTLVVFTIRMDFLLAVHARTVPQ